MQFTPNNTLFMQIAQRIRNQSHFIKIVKKQGHNYEFRSFQIQTMMPDTAIQLYQRFQHKYYQSHDLKMLPWFWHEQEKRLFVWFMTVYSYYAAKHNRSQEDYQFAEIAQNFFHKDPLFIEYQYHTILRQKGRVIWTQELDDMLRKFVGQVSEERWGEVSLKIFVESGKQHFRSFKQCRERWYNHLDQRKVRGNWTRKEDFLIIESVVERDGKHWSKIVPILEGKRTQHMIKNRFHTLVCRYRMYKNEKDKAIARRVLKKFRLERKNEPFSDDEGHYSVSSCQLNKPSSKPVKKQPICYRCEEEPQLQSERINVSPQIKQENILEERVSEGHIVQHAVKPEPLGPPIEQIREQQPHYDPFPSDPNLHRRFNIPSPVPQYSPICPNFSYAYPNPFGQFFMVPAPFVPLPTFTNPKPKQEGIPTGDTYVPKALDSHYQREAFPIRQPESGDQTIKKYMND